ncbi:hypothetical protein BJH93_00730 [Kocuria polaris]|nr:hypothetical protein [Kocuria polaris]
MRLISAQVRGFGRLVDTEIKLDQKLVAIVGPNEAGKTTLLKALAYVDESGTLTPAERSRASVSVADSTPVVSLRYRISDKDRERLEDLGLDEAPTEFFVSRSADGRGTNFKVIPEPRKSEVLLVEFVANLGDSLQAIATLEPLQTEVGEKKLTELPNGSSLLDDLHILQQDFYAYVAAPIDARESIDELRGRADEYSESLDGYVGTDRIRSILASLVAWIDRDDPKEATEKKLWSLTPDVVMFTEADRTLASTYTLDDALLGDVPLALANLARLAGLDLKALVQAVQASEISRRDTIKNKANIALASHFQQAWQQSDLKVNLNVEGKLLRIGIVEDGVHASVLDERSAGLRMFVAMTAFLAARSSGRATILLIDEAETHLHINAQADLVQMFAKQDQADKVIYTTHSPGCLPADLGVGIRAVAPDADETSHIENSFWRQGSGGLTSLMIAIGASAAAFTPARCAVIAEGATDMILLPTLVRRAIGADSLPYQVAPGLSELPKEAYPSLDFQAAKVAFLVDGDGGGRRLAKLIGRVIPQDRIVELGVHGIENTLDPGFYRDTFISLLCELNDRVLVGELPTLPGPMEAPWSTTLERWATGHNWRTPSKQEVASHIIELDEVRLSSDGSDALKRAHSDLLAALGLMS